MTTMAISPIDKELLKLISQLNSLQKKSLVNFIRPFILTTDSTERQTIDEYNLELDQAVKNVKKGNFTTLEDLEKEMESW
jgi:hypothetical protein